MAKETIQKIKLGELQVLPKEWGRRKISIDHVRCLENDLANGAKFPPLKVERKTKYIIGGTHRYKAYINFYGEGWENQEVDVIFIDLPPYDDDPVAWKVAIIDDNNHLAERMYYSDRNMLAADILRELRDPEHPLALEIAKKLHHTENSWLMFATQYLEKLQKEEEEKQIKAVTDKTHAENTARDTVQKQKAISGNKTFKAVHDDITPGEISALSSAGTRARVLSKANALLNELVDYSPSSLVPKEKEVFGKLINELKRLLSEVT